ncbi:uncharacterized protein LOC133462376 [Cololabis saira]|uniref:uncharacterized protein LOC133462376 n=1 Tax=Cololabis saira TaxID=129043 RepID=UPI002AD29E72|nr:uncharacterized protein LOC133462376 [Cololabis saira]
MENVAVLVELLLFIWRLLRTNMLTNMRNLRTNMQDVERRLQAATEDAIVKHKRVLEAIESYEEEDHRRSRKRARMIAVLHRRKPSVWKFNRTSEWWDTIVPGFSRQQWVDNFRMSEETYNFLCNKLRPAMERQDTTFRECVPLKKRVAVALWKLATGSEYRSIGHLFGVSITTVCTCVQDFCKAVDMLLLPEQIRFPDERRLRQIAAYNESRWGMPHCVGAIDGSHIPIIAPKDYHNDYFNRKGWHSIILQGVVDGKGLFWNVFAGPAGSTHDARVLRLSNLWELASRENLFPANFRNIGGTNVGYYILGDSAYPLQKWLMKPFHDTGRLTVDQKTFNYKFSRARVVVENAFGRLKGRWRCLLKRNDSDIKLVKAMVLACCALHNLCEGHGETYENSWDVPAAAAAPVEAAAQGSEGEQGGAGVRDALMRYLATS